MTRDGIKALAARERPGWRLVDVVEADDESGSFFEVAVERGDDRLPAVVVVDGRTARRAVLTEGRAPHRCRSALDGRGFVGGGLVPIENK